MVLIILWLRGEEELERNAFTKMGYKPNVSMFTTNLIQYLLEINKLLTVSNWGLFYPENYFLVYFS